MRRSACLAVAQVLLRFYDERHWMRAARSRVGHPFPRLLEQSEYNERLKQAGPLMQAAVRWLAEHTPATAEQLRLMDATPIGCGQSTTTARRSNLFGWACDGYESAHSRWYWVSNPPLTTADGTVTGFGLASPKLFGERAETREVLGGQPANRPRPGSIVVTDKARPAPTANSSSPTATCSQSARPAATRRHRDRSRTGCANASKRSSGP